MSSKQTSKPTPKRRNAVVVAAHGRNGGFMKNKRDRGDRNSRKRQAIQEAS